MILVSVFWQKVVKQSFQNCYISTFQCLAHGVDNTHKVVAVNGREGKNGYPPKCYGCKAVEACVNKVHGLYKNTRSIRLHRDIWVQQNHYDNFRLHPTHAVRSVYNLIFRVFCNVAKLEM